MFKKLSPESAKLRRALLSELRDRLPGMRKGATGERLKRLREEHLAHGGEVGAEDEEDADVDGDAAADLEAGEGENQEDTSAGEDKDKEKNETLAELIERLSC